jgi:hypothetical protein
MVLFAIRIAAGTRDQRRGKENMDYAELSKQEDWQKIAREIKNSDRPEIEKLARAFGWITSRIIEHGKKDSELARALRDEDSLVRNQIKTEAIRHARSIFQNCHLLATGRKAWDE